VTMAQDRSRRAVYVISVAAELAGMHPQTLRIYERRGLLDPARTGGGSRRYSDEDISRLMRIHQLTAEGLNLEGVRRVMELELEVARLQDELERVRAEAREAVERTHRQYRRDIVPVASNQLPARWRP
jgi:MerR family transcriptional regulator, heat shock protein HspR